MVEVFTVAEELHSRGIYASAMPSVVANSRPNVTGRSALDLKDLEDSRQFTAAPAGLFGEMHSAIPNSPRYPDAGRDSRERTASRFELDTLDIRIQPFFDGLFCFAIVFP